jgi:N-acetylglutamate synthase-like GNAT family acetyltransferase
VSYEVRQGPFLVSDDRARLDLSVIHGFLRTAYWSMGVPAAVVNRAIENSLCFGLFEHDRQVGFARAITDRATYAYLADVFVLPSHRDRGLGRWLVERVMAHPDLQGLRRFSLVTRDAHELYRPFGFEALGQPDRYMERFVPDVYARSEAS